LSDLNEKIDYLLENSESRTEIAENAQKIYKKTLSQEGMEEFAERIVKIVNH
jgi:spore maturation protein CgeB